MKKMILNFLAVAFLFASMPANAKTSEDGDDFLPAHEVQFSTLTKVGVGVGVLGLIGVATGVATIAYTNPPVGANPFISGAILLASGSALLTVASTTGLYKSNSEQIKKDYRHLLRYARVGARTGELSFHDGINQVYGRFVCDGMNSRDKVVVVSNLIMELDYLARVGDGGGNPSLEGCDSEETRVAIAGVLAAGLRYHGNH